MSEKEAVSMGQAAEVIVEELVLALVGLSAGAAVAGGLFSFIVELGVIADFADRTHTGDKLLFYETCVALGGIIGNIVFLFYSFAPRANRQIRVCFCDRRSHRKRIGSRIVFLKRLVEDERQGGISTGKLS